jgi:hypothetical protein
MADFERDSDLKRSYNCDNTCDFWTGFYEDNRVNDRCANCDEIRGRHTGGHPHANTHVSNCAGFVAYKKVETCETCGHLQFDHPPKSSAGAVYYWCSHEGCACPGFFVMQTSTGKSRFRKLRVDHCANCGGHWNEHAEATDEPVVECQHFLSEAVANA